MVRGNWFATWSAIRLTADGEMVSGAFAVDSGDRPRMYKYAAMIGYLVLMGC
jgi:hypothetical protein